MRFAVGNPPTDRRARSGRSGSGRQDRRRLGPLSDGTPFDSTETKEEGSSLGGSGMIDHGVEGGPTCRHAHRRGELEG